MDPFSVITLPEMIRNDGIAKEEKDVGHYVGLLVRVIVVVYLISE